MDPMLALEWQREQADFMGTSAAVRYLSLFIEHAAGDRGRDVVERAGGSESAAVKTAAAARMALLAGETYAVDEEMMDLVRYAADTLPDDTVHAWTPPSPVGFMLLPASEEFASSPPRAGIHVRAIAWSTYGGSVAVFYFSDNDDVRATLEEGTIGSHMSKIGGHLSFCHGQGFSFGSHVRAVGVVDPRGELPPPTEEDEHETTRMHMTTLALWHLCQQTVARPAELTVPRHAERRWVRAGGAPHKVVRVVRLRRRSGPAPEGEGREWHHRWIVRGHWRQQPYGPGRTLTRPVWVSEYVKGPDDKPLLASTKINYLVR